MLSLYLLATCNVHAANLRTSMCYVSTGAMKKTLTRAVTWATKMATKRTKVLTNVFDTIPDVEIQRIAQFLPITSLCNFRLACKRFHDAAPFVRVDKDGATSPVSPITVALAIDATDMDEDTFTNALCLDNAPALTNIVLSYESFARPAVKFFSQCLRGRANGNTISLYVRLHYPLYEPIVNALMNHPRIVQVDGIGDQGLYNSFTRYDGSWVQIKPFAGGPFDDVLWGSPRLEDFCDVHEIMQISGASEIDYWCDLFRRRDDDALKFAFDDIRWSRFASMLKAVGESVDSSESTRDLYARLYLLTYNTSLDDDLQLEDPPTWPDYCSDYE